MTVRCGTTRRLLWSDEPVRIADREWLDARAHADQCPSCRQFLADMQELSGLVRRVAPRPVTPPAVRTRVLAAVQDEPISRPTSSGSLHRTRRLIASAVAMIALIALVLWPAYQRGSEETWQQAMAAVLEDHAQGLHHESLATSDHGAARQWLTSRVAFAVQVPDVNGLVLERAEVCLIGGRRACLLRYRVDGQVVSYYSYKLAPEQLESESVRSAVFRQHEEAGYRVVAWQEAGVLHALVADVSADRLLALARACRARHERG